MEALLEGLLAGYGIAVPVGAVAVVIVGAAARHGRRAGMAAGAGAATADFVYATVAAAAGTAAASVVAPVERPARLVAGGVLVVIAMAMVVRLWRRRPSVERAVAPPPAGRLYAGVLGLTLANPVTLVYFASLMVGLPDGVLDGFADRVAFALAAGAASLSWQWLLAAAGGLLHGRLTPTMERATTLVGSATVATLGLRMALR